MHEDAIRPWRHRTWTFPRDPDFAVKAGRILDLYARRWNDRPLEADDFVLSVDEKTSIQARVRCHPSTPAGPARAMRVEHEYTRGGAWAYLAALDVHRAKIFGRCESTTGNALFHRRENGETPAVPLESATGRGSVPCASTMSAPPLDKKRRAFRAR